MTLSLPPNRRYTVEEYLELEGKSPEGKFEYREGIIVNMRDALAMAGGSIEHCLINANAIGALHQRLKGGEYHVYSNDLRMRIPRRQLTLSRMSRLFAGRSKPTCTQPPARPPQIHAGRLWKLFLLPHKILTMAESSDLHREIPTLREYVVVWQSEARIQTFFRRDDGGWSFDAFAGRDAIARLVSLEIDLPLAEVYANVSLPTEHPIPETGPV